MAKQFADLLGTTITNVEVVRGSDDSADHIDFTIASGDTYRLYHQQDCCEGVWIADINGDPTQLRGEVKLAEESVEDHSEKAYESATWTFYRIATDSQHVDIRWVGESNGYYSESVDWMKVS